MIQDDVEALQRKQKDLGSRIESAKESCLNNVLRRKHSAEEKEKFPLPDGEQQVTCEAPEAAPKEEEEGEEEEAAAVEKWEEDQDTNQVSAHKGTLSHCRC